MRATVMSMVHKAVMTGVADVVVGISAAVIVLVFCLQRLGSRRIGFLYSPILILWFVVNASIGIFNIIKWQPDVFKVRIN